MKKITTIFAFMLLAVAFTSCDSKKSDAKKLAEISCKMQKLAEKGDYTSDDYTKLAKEGAELSTKLEKKYKDDKDFAMMLLQEMSNCSK
jgi:hypothetical protein